MLVLSAIYLFLLVARLDVFCEELVRSFHDQTVPCQLLIDQFSLTNNNAVQPSVNYLLTLSFAWLTLGLWTLSVGVMAARCYLGIDFETLYASPPYSNGNGQQEAASERGYGGVACSVNAKRNILKPQAYADDEVEDLAEDAASVVMHLNGKELKLSADRANHFVDTIDEDQEMARFTAKDQAPKRIRLVNEVARPKIPKTVRLKSYHSSSA